MNAQNELIDVTISFLREYETVSPVDRLEIKELIREIKEVCRWSPVSARNEITVNIDQRLNLDYGLNTEQEKS